MASSHSELDPPTPPAVHPVQPWPHGCSESEGTGGACRAPSHPEAINRSQSSSREQAGPRTAPSLHCCPLPAPAHPRRAGRAKLLLPARGSAPAGTRGPPLGAGRCVSGHHQPGSGAGTPVPKCGIEDWNLGSWFCLHVLLYLAWSWPSGCQSCLLDVPYKIRVSQWDLGHGGEPPWFQAVPRTSGPGPGHCCQEPGSVPSSPPCRDVQALGSCP